ncbi:hypothetical protein JQS43_24050 [Natronosporangium hydrolyticum]|uniref:DUF4352 domain-containing protein n=1 Tax=Natronosporangium hydrolyticum TaxID=2811111 RepID=A0A895YIU8_9ACTN|nr:DUF4352 domain-containing protein [Natronosporangium hydrolyticum]QSB14516.1 hypothetical protein JQS43_24050 [Natronosporangium hydrolyticum]
MAATIWQEHWRAITAGSVALGGLALLAFAPAGLALGVERFAERNADAAIGHPLGAEVTDGHITFIVHEIRCGPDEQGETTHGRLCEVTIGARNDGTATATIPGDRQHLAGPDGLRHLPVPGEPAPFGTLPPGTAATAVLSYDLPEHADITHVRLHGDVYTEGESVGLDAPPLPR